MLNGRFFYAALIPCDYCGVLFDLGVEPLVFDIPDTSLRFIVVGDFCPKCSEAMRSELVKSFVGFQAPAKRR